MIELVVARPYNILVTVILTLLEIGIMVVTIWTTLINPADDFKELKVPTTRLIESLG